MTSDLVSTGVAAKQLGIAASTLVRWWQRGLVEPAWVTAGGHARWNVDALKQQVRDLRDHDDE
ncbi:MAG TPA: MerR family DNA-binding transcriptional regulator [Pseudonocardiaceae bacterium]